MTGPVPPEALSTSPSSRVTLQPMMIAGHDPPDVANMNDSFRRGAREGFRAFSSVCRSG